MKKLLLFSSILFSSLYGVTSAQDLSAITKDYVTKVTSNLYEEPGKSVTEKRQLQRVMSQLCQNIYAEQKNLDTVSTEVKGAKLYDPRQSIFVTVMCNSFTGAFAKPIEEYKEGTIWQYLKRKNLSDMNIFCAEGQAAENNAYCVKVSYNNSLDYNYLMLQTIKRVQNDRGNIGLIRAYGFQNLEKTAKKEDIANQYLGIYYGVIAKTPEAKDYPKTHKELIRVYKEAERILQKSYFLDMKKIQSEEAKTPITENYPLRNSVFFAINEDQDNIINAMYNELFFYILFSSVYNEHLPLFWEAKDNNNKPIGLQDIEKYQDRVLFVQQQGVQQRAKIQQTTEQTIKEINNLQGAFPLHIGFLLYQEDLYNLRKRLSNIYLPLHQLHYKLENIQNKE